MSLLTDDLVVFNYEHQWNKDYGAYPAVIVRQGHEDHYVLRINCADDPGGKLASFLGRKVEDGGFEFNCWKNFFTPLAQNEIHLDIETLI